MSFAAVIILTGALTAASCSLVGCFLVLRRMALVGDAISHSVLLGIVAVFALTGARSGPLLVVGAAAVGLLTVVLIEAVRRTGRVREDAAIGLVFPALFSIGVILVSRFPNSVHIDVQHLLYGEIAFSPLYRVELWGADLGYRSLWMLGGMTAANLAFVVAFYKELKLATFDPALAAAVGLSPVVVHYALMAMVSATTVVAFDSVGSILVVAMLVVPPATAYLLTNRLATMLTLSVLVGTASAVGGYLIARLLDSSTSGAMAAMAGVLFATALLLSPSQGLIARRRELARLRRGLAERLLLTHLDGGHGAGDRTTLRERFGWSARTEATVVRSALARGHVRAEGSGRLVLTEAGRGAAGEIGVG